MAPRVNTIPDPSSGLITCKGGINSVDPAILLGQHECQELENLFPSEVPFLRNGNEDVFADDTVLASESGAKYTPYSFQAFDPNGNEYIFAWTMRLDSYIAECNLEVIKLTGTTNTRYKIFRAYYESYNSDGTHKPIGFKFVKIHGEIYCATNGIIREELRTSGTHPYIDGPLIIFWDGTDWNVRPMGIDISPNIDDVGVAYSKRCLSDVVSTADSVPVVPDYPANRSIGINFIRASMVNYKNTLYIFSENNIYTSFDGVKIEHFGKLPYGHYCTSRCAAFVWHGEMWLVCKNNIIHSVDGVTWATQTFTSWTGNVFDGYACAILNDRLLITAGTYSYYIDHAETITTGVMAGALPKSVCAHEMVAYNGMFWIIGGRSYQSLVTGQNSDVMYSTDGITWGSHIDSLLTGWQGHKVLVFNGAMHNIAGSSNYINDGLGVNSGHSIRRSIDGITWTTVSNNAMPWCLAAILNGVVVMIEGYDTDICAGTPGSSTILGMACDYSVTKKTTDMVNFTTHLPGVTTIDPSTWAVATDGEASAPGYISTSFTFVRRTDSASILGSVERFKYDNWKSIGGKLQCGKDEVMQQGSIVVSDGVVTGYGTDFLSPLTNAYTYDLAGSSGTVFKVNELISLDTHEHGTIIIGETALNYVSWSGYTFTLATSSTAFTDGADCHVVKPTLQSVRIDGAMESWYISSIGSKTHMHLNNPSVSTDESPAFGMICYGGGTFVAIPKYTEVSKIATSQDGVNWTLREGFTGSSWGAVCYGNGLFVAVSRDDSLINVITSPDGITWTHRTGASINAWHSVCYGNGLFVAVAQSGSGNRVMTSPDGITWTSRSSACDAAWASVCYGNGLFVAVATTEDTYSIMTSPDGITWTGRGTGAWDSVCYGNGLFVAVGSGTGEPAVYISSNGITWAQVIPGVDTVHWGCICYGNGIFIAMSTGSTSIATSPNGSEWTLRDTEINGYLGACYGGGLFIAVSYDAPNGSAVSSANGIAWSTINLAAKKFSLLPSVGDYITTNIYNPGDTEGIEDSFSRKVVQIPSTTKAAGHPETDYCTIIITMPSRSQIDEAIQKGATHVRFYRSIVATSPEMATGLYHGYVCDIALQNLVVVDETGDTTITANIGLGITQQMTTATKSYCSPPSGRFMDFINEKVWLADDVGNVYYSETPNVSFENIKKYMSMFSLSCQYSAFDPDSGYQNTGIFGFYGDLIVFKEDKIFALSGANPLNAPTVLSDSLGCPFPNTIVRANDPKLGQTIFFVSDKGPAAITVGGAVQLLTGFKVKELWPVTTRGVDGSGEVFTRFDRADSRFLKNEISAHYSHSTYWIHYGDSDCLDCSNPESNFSFKCFGYYIPVDGTTAGALECVFPEFTCNGVEAYYEPRAFINCFDGKVLTLSHISNETDAKIYRLTEFLKSGRLSDSYLNNITGPVSTSFDDVNYSLKVTSKRIPIAKSLEYAGEVYALAMHMKTESSAVMHVKIVTDSNRLICEGDYTQERQSGVSNEGHSSYRHKVVAIPKAGLVGSFVHFEITMEADAPIEYYGAALQVISRDIPAECLSALDSLTTTTGALTFVEKSDQSPSEIDSYA